MEDSTKLKQMYTNLTNADLKAICKNRVFSSDEVSSFELFETVYLSEKGIKSAFHLLSDEELILLHLLNLLGNHVDISFFKSFYDPDVKKKDMWYIQTFNERYKKTFKKVRKRLIRTGILAYYEKNMFGSGTVKLERYRFFLPTEFISILPNPCRSIKIGKRKGKRNITVIRSKCKQVFTQHKKKSPEKIQRYDIRISTDHKLYMGKKKFTTSNFEQWRETCWHKSTTIPKSEDKELSPFDLISYIFSLLSDDQWILPDDLDIFWNVYYTDQTEIDNKKICENGWKWGFLLKYTYKNNTYYRPVTSIDSVNPENYITITKDLVYVDIEKIPLEYIEILNTISTMTIKENRLQITPDIIGIGNMPHSFLTNEMVVWLKRNSTVFRNTFDLVDKRKGKRIVHDNLLVAEISDISLFVKLVKSFSSTDLIKVSDEVVAFPKGLLPDITHFVKKNGFVVKTWEKND
ncbi:MAG TPA: hypothetical protein VKP59_07300 [Candidatus Thermoplasmatota archaeon]|nr:hypothetical protein [Candidatus Thermoplasmatota archaeon]